MIIKTGDAEIVKVLKEEDDESVSKKWSEVRKEAKPQKTEEKPQEN